MPRYEFSEGTSNKFWQIDLAGTSFTTTFGKIGTAGQSSTKSFDSEAKTLVEYNKLIAEKTKKGYRLVSGASAAMPAAPKPASPKTVTAPKPAPTPASGQTLSAAASDDNAPITPTNYAPPRTPALDAGPSVRMTPAALRAADKEIAAHAIKPRKGDNPIGRWITDVFEPFRSHGKKGVQHGVNRGDAEAERLSRAVLDAYGSIKTMPKTLDVSD